MSIDVCLWILTSVCLFDSVLMMFGLLWLLLLTVLVGRDEGGMDGGDFFNIKCSLLVCFHFELPNGSPQYLI